ncbi:hypothetical protein [Micromonospora sp. WMMD1274]|uniref:hypothetical protein n=1 Tax=Micromonospora sp. WMMD1274 TaxID=3404116 RepID=UPI003B93348F
MGRAAAAAFYWDLCDADLPDEPELRACFGDLPAQAASAVRLSGPEARRGFRETRVYRILFADELIQDALAALSEEWQMPTRTMSGAKRTVLTTARTGYDPMGRPTSSSVGKSADSGPVGWWKLDETSYNDNAGFLGLRPFISYDSSPSHNDMESSPPT